MLLSNKLNVFGSSGILDIRTQELSVMFRMALKTWLSV